MRFAAARGYLARYGCRREAAIDATRERWVIAAGGHGRQLLTLLALVGGHVVAFAVGGREWVTQGQLALPVLLGGLLLTRRYLAVLAVGVAVALGVESSFDDASLSAGTVLLIALVLAVSYDFAASRERTGLPVRSGDSMLVELRERLRTQGRIPPLPAGWHVEVLQESAEAGVFGGDFVVAALTNDGKRLEIAVVDVSGKGNDAGSRALLLSGAMGGLLGSATPDAFLVAANGYLRRQEWQEGFATAVHVAIDLDTGGYVLGSAGHPPAAHFVAGSGRWHTCQVGGSVLGLFDEDVWPHELGELRPGDAMLLYTDGIIEVPGRDLDLGIDKLLGEANRLVISTFVGGTDRLADAMRSKGSDDRSIVLVWRS